LVQLYEKPEGGNGGAYWTCSAASATRLVERGLDVALPSAALVVVHDVKKYSSASKRSGAATIRRTEACWMSGGTFSFASRP